MQDHIRLAATTPDELSTTRPEAKVPIRSRILTPFVCTVVASIGIFGGVSALAGGLLCAIVHMAMFPESAFDRAATFLLIIAIPMILAGSVFLDEIDMQRRRGR